MLTVRCGVGTILSLLLLWGTSALKADPSAPRSIFSDDPATRLAVPDADKVTAANKLIQEIYRSQLADPSEASSKALARQMLDDADRNHNDPVGNYALLCRARDLAIDVADVGTAFNAAHDLAAKYEVDGPSVEADVLRRIAPRATLSADAADVANRGLQLIEELLSAGRYDDLAAILPPVQAAAVASGRAETKAKAMARIAFVRSMLVEFERVRPALDTLAKNPDNPAANDAAGKFYFVFGDWSKGLPLLAKGPGTSDTNSWKSVALIDVGNPQSPTEQADLATAWWDLGKQQSGAAQGRCEARAAFWYGRALPGLHGIAKALAEKRLAEAGVPAMPPEPAQPVAQRPAAPSVQARPPAVQSPPAERPSSNGNGAVVIISARWGGGKHWADVTEKVKNLVMGQDKFWANPKTLGADPTPGWRKHLEIDFVKDGQNKKIWVDEDKSVNPTELGS